MDSDENGRRENRQPRQPRRSMPRSRRGSQRALTGTSAAQTDDDDTSVPGDAIHPATAVLQIDDVRRYLGAFIHTATRNDVRSRAAVHRAIPALALDLAALFRLRERRWLDLVAVVIPLARHPRSRDVDVVEQHALRDAWSSILEGAPNRRQALASATRQVAAWRVSDALPWLVSAMPPQTLFVDGIVRAPGMAASAMAQTYLRNALRLRGVAAMLADAEDEASTSITSPQAVARCDALIDALAPAYNVDLMQATNADALRLLVTEWTLNGWLASMLGVLPASLDWQAGEGLPGVEQLGGAMRRAHRLAQRMQWSDALYAAAAFFESTSVDDPIPHQHRFRLIYALHDALRDADHRPSSSVDAIAAQFAAWHGAGRLPLLAAATIDDYFYRDGRLRLCDIDAHLTREWALMCALPPTHVQDASMQAFSAYLDARAAENQFRILEGILLRECGDFVRRSQLQAGLDAFRDSPLLARFNDQFPAGWYETLLTDARIAPFNTQIIAILHDALRVGFDIDESATDWVDGLRVTPATLGAVWRQREIFRFLSDRYRQGLALRGVEVMPEASIVIGLDAYLLFDPHIGDRRAQAFSRWIDRATPEALEGLPPAVLFDWIALLLNVTISDAAVDHWLAGWEGATLADGRRSLDDARLAMQHFDAAGSP